MGDTKLFLGVDPGVSGAWAVVNEESTVLMAGLWQDYDVLVRELKNGLKPALTALEKCHSMPRQGVASTFTFGENIGFWKGLLTALDVQYVEVTPGKWQKTILDFLPTKELPAKEEDLKECSNRLARNRRTLKNSIVEFVKRRFPSSKAYLLLQKHQGIADAICMAEYARKSLNGV